MQFESICWYVCVRKVIIGSGKGSTAFLHQVIIWTIADFLSFGSLGTNLEIWKSQFSFERMNLKMLLAKWWPFSLRLRVLTHWGWVTHICVSKLTIIGSENGLSPGRGQAIIWTNAGILLIGPLGTNFSEILIEHYIFLFNKMHLKMSSGNWRPLYLDLGLNVLNKLCNGGVTCLFNTLRPRQNGRRFPGDIFKCIFLNENAWISIKISLKFVPKG